MEARRRRRRGGAARVTASVPELPALPTLRDAAARRAPVDVRLPRQGSAGSTPTGCCCGTGSGTSSGATTSTTSRARTASTGSTATSRSSRTPTFERPRRVRPPRRVPDRPEAARRRRATSTRSRGARRRGPGRRPSSASSARTASSHAVADGAIDVEVPCANLPAFRSWVLGLLEHAEVLGPAGRARRRRRVAAARMAAGRWRQRVTAHRPRNACSRLLVMLPWLMERGEVPLAEVAQRFGITPEEVAADLELAAMCGLPPFVDEMIDVFIDDDVVVVGVPRLFTRPLRLTAPEGFALVAAGRAAMQLPGRRPRPARSGAVCRSWRPRSATTPSSSTCPARRRRRPRSTVLTAAIGAAERLAVRYWTASRDEVTERTITPRRVVHDRGEWYVVADDQRSGERRTFRVDRFESLAADRRARRRRRTPASVRSRVEWFADGGLPQVTLRLAPAARVGGRALPGRRRRRARRRRRRGHVSRWPASAGSSGCCCGSGDRGRGARAGSELAPSSRRRRGSARCCARYGE